MLVDMNVKLSTGYELTIAAGVISSGITAAIAILVVVATISSAVTTLLVATTTTLITTTAATRLITLTRLLVISAATLETAVWALGAVKCLVDANSPTVESAKKYELKVTEV